MIMAVACQPRRAERDARGTDAPKPAGAGEAAECRGPRTAVLHAVKAYALNDLRNAAGALAADYVHRSEPTFSAPYGHVTQADYHGYAYRCSKR